MHGFKFLTLTALALPAMAMAQVGPNPAAPGGSTAPSIGAGDMMTAPQDAQIGGRASGNVMDRTIDTRTNSTVDTGATVGPGTTTSGATTSNDATATGTGTTVGTETRTKTHTRGMEPAKRRR